MSQWDSASVPSSLLTSISIWAEVLLKKSLLRVTFQLLRSSKQPSSAGAAHEPLLGTSCSLWEANSICWAQGW